MNESFSMTASLVLIPGLNNTRAVFDQVVSELPPDVLGMALDNPALPSVDEIAQALLPALPERFWLAGFSFGGYVAMALLAAVPERVQGIAMICTSPAGESSAAAAKRQLALEAVAHPSADAFRAAMGAPFSLHPGAMAPLRLGLAALQAEVALKRDEVKTASGEVMPETRLTAWQSDFGDSFRYSGKAMAAPPGGLTPRVAAARDALEAKFGAPERAKLAWKPTTTVPVDESAADSLFKLVETLEDNDDVQTVWGNYEVADAVLEKLAG